MKCVVPVDMLPPSQIMVAKGSFHATFTLNSGVILRVT